MKVEPTVSISASLKLNLGNYESGEAFVCVSGLPAGATEEQINELLDTGKLAFSIIRKRIVEQAREMRDVRREVDKPAPLPSVENLAGKGVEACMGAAAKIIAMQEQEKQKNAETAVTA